MPDKTDETDDTQDGRPEADDSDASAQPEDTDPGQPDSGDADGVIHQLRPEPAEATLSADEDGDDDDADGWRNLHRMLDVPLQMTVELGSTEMALSEVLRLEGGSVITIDRMPGEPIDLLVNGRVFARGEVVVINDTFGYRITELVDDAESTIEIARDGG